MGLYHSVGLGYGIEIPNTTDIDAIGNVLRDQPNIPDRVGYIVVGDCDRLLLVTRYQRAEENEVVRLTGDSLAAPGELAVWEEALHAAAIRLGLTDHPAPAWLLIHDYS